MTTTISGSAVTFTDGSVWGGANGSDPVWGGLIVAPNTNRADTSFNIGHVILANCIFNANNGGFTTGGITFWALNSTNSYYHIYAGMINRGPAANVTTPTSPSYFPADHPAHGSQSYFALGDPGITNGGLVGTWKARGQACAAGINQTNGYFVLMERVA
jgi:hypothetical protein